ncbi:MAG TPA: formylmethanofuran dehydrogenase subunit C [Methanosphaera sp.]|nr:formylmethanofuran dehydrogenase subunit C [Methanosphaera sp.]HII08259.1 formylmethanofuran dehydrogenase subunit C [Methanosphaera sp.]HIJ16046.1 formylmethanofuran dehydrogenase subunit C [Methanosphaera sp.]
MRIINLIMKEKSSIALEFDNVLPELLFDKSLSQIREVTIYRGNREEQLCQYFDVETSGKCEDASECTIVIDGDLSRVKRIGFAMSCGKIIANSSVDFHVGACMSGGEIIVNGDAESYAGREMTGGTLEILGSVKEFCGSSYAGEWRGMSGGEIIIHENAGKHLADYMIGGSIHIMGNCDILAGVHMSGGRIQIDGDVTQWLGGQMKKGTIILNGKIKDVLPGFIFNEYIHHPLIGDKYYVGRYGLYSGDKTVRGKGQLWIKQ